MQRISKLPSTQQLQTADTSMTPDADMIAASPRISALEVFSPAAKDVPIEMHERRIAIRPCLRSAADASELALDGPEP